MKTVRDKGEVSKVLDDMDRTCDQLEDSLRKTKQGITQAGNQYQSQCIDTENYLLVR
jgi:hypothetical protein